MASRLHCDDPEIFLTAVQTGQSSIYIHAHNQTDKVKSVVGRRARNFPMMTGKKQDPSFK